MVPDDVLAGPLGVIVTEESSCNWKRLMQERNSITMDWSINTYYGQSENVARLSKLSA